jgi:hypothetical protein
MKESKNESKDLMEWRAEVSYRDTPAHLAVVTARDRVHQEVRALLESDIQATVQERERGVADEAKWAAQWEAAVRSFAAE